MTPAELEALADLLAYLEDLREAIGHGAELAASTSDLSRRIDTLRPIVERHKATTPQRDNTTGSADT